MQSIRLRLILLFIVVTTTTLGIFAYYEQRLLQYDLEARFQAQQEEVATRLQQNLAQPLWEMDQSVINAKLESALIAQDVQGVYLYIPDQPALLAGLTRTLNGGFEPVHQPPRQHGIAMSVEIFPPAQVDAARRKVSIGRVRIDFSRARVEQILAVALLRRTIEVLVANILLLLVLFFSLRLVFDPLRALRDALRHLASPQAEALQALPLTNLTEFDQVVTGFNATLDKVKNIIAHHRQAEEAARAATETTNLALAQVQEAQAKLLATNHQLALMTVTDSLTGLGNRMKLDQVLAEELRRHHRYRCPFCLIMLDIDHFKQVNDRYGHQAGDQVLVALAQLLRANTRSVDVVGRWGGEEFLLICRDTALPGAHDLAEKLRQAIHAHPFPIETALSASFGVACVQDNDSDHATLLRADQALYRAKAAGRNQVVCAPPSGETTTDAVP